ncbi:MAG: DUF616 domain-containing protein [Lachnospiraceae bacterium]|nr:DUF616 domain-containing protein [Lachnospiraceae bacterium]
MKEKELIHQVITLLDYMMDNGDSLSDRDFEAVITSVSDILRTSFGNEAGEDDLRAIEDMIKSGDINVLLFYRSAMKILVGYLTSGTDGRQGVDKQYVEKMSFLMDQVKSDKELIDKLETRYEHIYNITRIYNKRYREETTHFKGKGVIYSVITGGYDTIAEPEADCGLEYIMLTDKAPKGYSGKWKIRVVDNPKGLSAGRLARYVKMHPWEYLTDYDWSVYVDGKLMVIGDFHDYISYFGRKSGMICFPHYDTNDLEEQAKAIAMCGKADMPVLEAQIAKYSKDGYQGKGYLVETACLVRDHHDEKLRKVMEDWWTELNSYDHNRDQMSFDYACWKNDYEYDICNHLIYNNPWCIGVAIH